MTGWALPAAARHAASITLAKCRNNADNMELLGVKLRISSVQKRKFKTNKQTNKKSEDSWVIASSPSLNLRCLTVMQKPIVHVKGKQVPQTKRNLFDQ